MRKLLQDKSSVLLARNTTTHKRDKVHMNPHPVNFINQGSSYSKSEEKGARMTVYFVLLFQ